MFLVKLESEDSSDKVVMSQWEDLVHEQETSHNEVAGIFPAYSFPRGPIIVKSVKWDFFSPHLKCRDAFQKRLEQHFKAEW